MESTDFPRLIAGLKNPRAYPHPVERVEHIETHISHVLLAGGFVYKLKKPVNLGFLDFSTPELRRHFCKEEVRLNRRLAARIYIGVVPITGTPDAPEVGGPGPLLEYAVSMHRFPQDALLARTGLTPMVIDQLAERLAAFHRAIPVAPKGSGYGTPDAVLAPMIENLRHARARVNNAENARRLDAIEAWTRAKWLELTPALELRLADGRVRECHGDMHRGNIALVNGEPLIFDALEFNPSLRWIDTASELAFLIMDLEETGEFAFGQRLLNGYLVAGGDYGGLEVLDFYKVYRAMVRAKVLAIRLGQGDLSAEEARLDRSQSARYLALAESYTRVRQPRLILLCGLSGSGKSRLGARLREALPAIHLRSDVERKRIFGLDAVARSEADLEGGIYFPLATEWTYGRLERLADRILGCGYDVLVDATFLDRRRRRAFAALAQGRRAAFAMLVTTAPLAVLRERVQQRQAEGTDPSEAGLSVLECQVGGWQDLDGDEAPQAWVIDTTSPPTLDEILARIAALTGVPLDSRPADPPPAI